MSAPHILKKGAPSRSYPSHQRKLGPAPFASFEDLDEVTPSPSQVDLQQEGGQGEEEKRPLTQIQEEIHDPQPPAHRPVGVTVSSGSGATSGLQTPSTPRIDISCPSSSTSSSEEESSEQELFQGGLGFSFQEEGTAELKSSTEELDLGKEDIDSEEERRQKKLEKETGLKYEDIIRRSSHPANIFNRRKSSGLDLDLDSSLVRKPSAHTLFLEGLLSRPGNERGRTGSFGAHSNPTFTRPTSALSAHSGSLRCRSGSRSRSPSPHRMMLETSFCGSKPIPTKSMEIPDSPEEKSQPQPDESLTATPVEKQGQRSRQKEKAKPRSEVKEKPIQLKEEKVTMKKEEKPPDIKKPQPDAGRPQNEQNDKPLLVQPKSPHREPTEPESKEKRSLSIKSLTPSYKSPYISPCPSPSESRRPSSGQGSRSVSPFRLVYETSFCGNKPIPSRSMDVQESEGQGQSESEIVALLTQAQVHCEGQVRSTTPPSPKSSDHWTPVAVKSPRTPKSPFSKSEESSPSLSQSTAKYVSTPVPEKGMKLGSQQTNVFKWPDPPPPAPPTDERTTELSFTEPPSSLPLEDALEAEFLKGHSSPESDIDPEYQGELPFVPTTLPMETPSTALYFPSRSSGANSNNSPAAVSRPRVAKPPNPANINDYILQERIRRDSEPEAAGTKMRVKLPLNRDDSIDRAAAAGYSNLEKSENAETVEASTSEYPRPRSKSRGSISAQNWADFAEMGLRSPREIRKKLNKE